MASFSDSFYARTLRALAQAVCRHPGWFVYPQIVLAALCVFYTAHALKLDMNRDNLVGANARYQQIYLNFRKEFPGQDELIVLVEGGRRERERQFLERLAARVGPETNLFTDLFYRTDLASLGSKGLLLASTNELAELHRTLREYLPFIQNFTQATNLNSLFALVNEQFRTASATAATNAESMVNALPFLQRVVVEARHSLLRPGHPPSPGIDSLFAGGGTNAEEQVYITMDRGRLFLLTVRPRNEAATPEAIDRLRQLIHATQVEVPGVNVGLTGGPVLDYDEMRQTEHDSIRASIVALVLCSLIFIVAYGEVNRPLKAAFCLLIGMSYSLGFTTLVIGHLNILTITFAPMLIGLAIDFGVHFITRYEEESRKGASRPESVRTAMVFTGQGIITGAFTTAAAFLAMGLTNFKGIREMGIISGGGLLLCLAPMMTTLPALLLRGRRDRAPTVAPVGHKRLELEQLWLRRPAVVVALTLVLCAAVLPQVHRVYFDYDLLHLQTPGLASVRYEQRLIHSGGRSAIFGAVIADSPAQAREFERKLKQLPAVAGVDSVASYLGGNQDQKLQRVRAIQHELAPVRFQPIDRRPVDVKALGATLWYLTGYAGLAADQAQAEAPAVARQLRSFRASLTLLRKALLNEGQDVPVQLGRYQQALFADVHRTFGALKHQDTTGPLRAQDLPPSLRDRFVGVSGKYLLQVYGREDLWQHDNQGEFIRQLQSVVPPDRVTGTPVGLYEYTTLLKVSYQQAALYSLLAIALMVFLHFRSVFSVILSLLPVAIGAVWLLGYMVLAGVPFNPANIMTLPLVVGIGVTNGIQVLNRFAEERTPGIFSKSTGKAILVSGLTTITGFGTLLLSKHQGIKSLGEVMSVGIAACMIAGLVFLPSLLCLLLRRGWSLPARFGPAPALDGAR